MSANGAEAGRFLHKFVTFQGGLKGTRSFIRNVATRKDAHEALKGAAELANGLVGNPCDPCEGEE